MPSILPEPEPRTPREEMQAYLEQLVAQGRAVRQPDGKVRALAQRDWPRDCAPAARVRNKAQPEDA